MKNLILIVGASGSGKDSLLKAARFYFKDNSTIHFIRRYITRKPGEFEENFYIDDIAFNVLKNHGFFVSYWHAHHLKYGIPKHEIEFLKDDETAIISISRTKIEDFEQHFPGKVTTVHVTADRTVIEERLKKRQRETQLQIETRLQRIGIPVIAKNLIPFDNNEELEISSMLFVTLLKKIVSPL